MASQERFISVFCLCILLKILFKIFIQYLFCVGKAMNARFYFTLS